VGHHSLLQMLSRCWVTPQQQRFNCAELIAEVAPGSNAAVQNNRPSQARVTATRKGLRPRANMRGGWSYGCAIRGDRGREQAGLRAGSILRS
jgi:hypothetical protein